jgi:hypothetical protein
MNTVDTGSKSKGENPKSVNIPNVHFFHLMKNSLFMSMTGVPLVLSEVIRQLLLAVFGCVELVLKTTLIIVCGVAILYAANFANDQYQASFENEKQLFKQECISRNGVVSSKFAILNFHLFCSETNGSETKLNLSSY